MHLNPRVAKAAPVATGKAVYERLITRLKRILPQSLFGRALLILVLPTVLMQILAITIFYDRHWSSIQRHTSSSLAGEVAVVIERALMNPPEQRKAALSMYESLMVMDIALKPLSLDISDTGDHDRFARYVRALRRRTDLPFVVHELPEKERIRTRIALPRQLLQVDVGIKRLESSTTYIFVLWVVCSALLLTVIAIAFLRNQIRPISRLADAAERFGMGQDVGDFKPHGAEEVRKAGRAFMVMRSRITRQISTRTAMLTGISHDLRTPLTRLKLQLTMLDESEDVSAMLQDIADMEHMLGEYLNFARSNDETVPMEEVDIAEWLRAIVQAYTATGAPLSYSFPETARLPLRLSQMKRAVENLINNALKYGEQCHVSLEITPGWLTITFDDDGPGIDETVMEDVFRPFTRLDTSRNQETGGVGLGLAIARDIVQVHGGYIRMRNRYGEDGGITGLGVLMILPLPGR